VISETLALRECKPSTVQSAASSVDFYLGIRIEDEALNEVLVMM
jgi:hypothetical protein